MTGEMRFKAGATIRVQAIIAAAEEGRYGLANPGFCLACGAELDGLEPDAREVECECCGLPHAWGAEKLLFMLPPHIVEHALGDNCS